LAPDQDAPVATRKKTVNFEKKLVELENLVEALESGGLSLEESLKSFEKGIQITRECQEALKEAEQKVTLLTKSPDGESVAEEFEAPDDTL